MDDWYYEWSGPDVLALCIPRPHGTERHVYHNHPPSVDAVRAVFGAGARRVFLTERDRGAWTPPRVPDLVETEGCIEFEGPDGGRKLVFLLDGAAKCIEARERPAHADE